MEEVKLHNKENDIWVLYKGKVYDLSKFYKSHPGGPDVIEENAGGKDATKIFDDANHPKNSRKEMETYCIGELIENKKFTKLEEIAEHNKPGDLWLLIHNKVYDVSTFKHPGGNEILLQNAAMDATTQFEDINHSAKAHELMRKMYVGDFYNPDEAKESWEDYTKRKQLEEQGQLSIVQKLVLVGLFLTVFFYLYTYLTAPKVK
jgi:cytochrome b involved in lipid metabolism